MNSDLFALMSFVIITTFTPGPNNISSASQGVLFGYRKALPYLILHLRIEFCILFGHSLFEIGDR